MAGVAQRAIAHELGLTDLRRADVLDQERDAAQRAGRERPARSPARLVEQRAHDRAEPRVETLAASDRRVDELERRQLAALDQLGLRDGIEAR